MSRPRFSIVIPTRQRHQTLAYAIQSVLFQDYADFELIVQDNCSGPETWDVVKQFRTPKLKYQRSPRVLPMNQNWEMGLALCEGEFLFYMGDDDALMPDGLRLAQDILSRARLDVLTWQKYTYWWENALEPTLHGRLFVHTGCNFQAVDPRSMLEAFYDWKIGFGTLPSIYTSLVHRDVVARAKARTGGTYFTLGAPDVWTGIVNAFLARQVGVFERGLSISGNSGPSTGCSAFFRSKGAARLKEYYNEEGKTLEELTHPALIPSVNLEINHADHQLRAKEMLFPDDVRLQVKMPLVLASMAANLNRDPDSYDVVLEELRQLAAKHSIPLSSLAIPPRARSAKQTIQGPIFGPDQKLQCLAVNCPEAGVRDAHQAARLTAALLPQLTIQ
jgi:glycosyltransferase involved in cell wall biosynthesis